MTNPQIFDGYANDYAATVDGAIGKSGETVEFFAVLKAELMLQELADDVPRTVLDFGCGTGTSTRALATLFPAASITGCDPSVESIREARTVAAQGEALADFVHQEGRTLPFEDGAFDAIFTACVFHHIEREDHLAWLREIRRVLRPGGSFLMFEHNPYNPLTLQVVRNCPFDEGVTLLPPRYARRLLRSAGFFVHRPRYYFFFPAILKRLRVFEPMLRWFPLGAQYYVRGQGQGRSPGR